MWVQTVSIGAEYCPLAVADYKKSSAMLGPNHKDLLAQALKVRKHLVFLGWKIEHWIGGKRMKYTSPSGGVYYSLRDICFRVGNLQNDMDIDTVKLMHDDWSNSRSRSPSPSASPSPSPSPSPLSPSITSSAVEEFKEKVINRFGVSEEYSGIVQKYAAAGICTKSRSIARQARNYLCTIGWRIDSRIKNSKKEKVYISPTGRKFYSLRTACVWWSKHDRLSGNKLEEKEIFEEEKSTCRRRHNKRKREEISTYIIKDSRYNQNKLLSKLIDSHPDLLGARVEYRSKKNGPSLKEGQLYPEGIKCFCCQQLFNLSKFEGHAGSQRHRPSECLFLEDGRSLMDCRYSRSEVKKPETGHDHDFVCSVCRQGGEFILCNGCPSAYHSTCLAQIYKEVSGDNWYCPSCCCGLCGDSFEDGSGRFEFSVECGHCRVKYHVGCSKAKYTSIGAESNWFCSERCELIHSGLQELVEKPGVQLGSDHNLLLTWISIKQTKEHAEKRKTGEIRKKLNLALELMHESFNPIREGGQDIIKSLLFNRWSKLNRLNFENFYTLVLERDNKLTTVATIRIHEGKVAELPLVATKRECRGEGLCRMLMNSLEKTLMEFGVERLILPSSDHAIDTWINSFGFSVMDESQILELSKYVFLNFPDTILCHKFLRSRPIPHS